MGAILNKTQYTSVSNAQPFALSLSPGYVPAPDGEKVVFHVAQAGNRAIYALVEGVVSGGSLTITQIIETSGDPIPLFSGGVTIHAALNVRYLSAEQGQGRDAILLIGQSNMAGHNGEAEEAGLRGYDAALDTPNPQILELRKTSRYTVNHTSFLNDSALEDQYTLAVDPLDHANDAGFDNGAVRATSVGLGLTLAKRYAMTTTRQVVILPAAKGSTGLVAGGTSQAAPNGAEFLHAVAMVNEFMAENPDNRLVMIADQQGETDAFALGTLTPGQWGAAKSLNIATFRANGTFTPSVRQPTFEKVPYVMGQVTSTGTDSQTINQDIDDIVGGTPYTARALYDPSWLKGGSFDLHVDAVGLREWGHLFYAQYVLALQNTPALPARPLQVQNVAATQDPTVVHLTWDALPAQDPAITAYNVQFKETAAGDQAYSAPIVLGAAVVAHDVTGLTNATDYTFRVYASSPAGDSPFALITETPEVDGVPSAPANFAIADGTTQIVASWDALVFDPVVTGYVLQIRETGVGDFGVEIADIAVAGQATTSQGWTPLANNTNYDFRLRAVNAIGSGDPTAIITQAHSSSPTLALTPYLWLRKGIGLSVNGDSVNWLDQSTMGNDASPVAGREVNLSEGGINTLSDGRLQVPEAARLHEGGYTIVARVKPSKTGTRAIFGLTSGIWVGQGLTDRVRAQGNSSLYMTTDPFFANGVEATFAVTHSGSEARFYDGSTFVNVVSGTLGNFLAGVRYLGAWNSFSSSDWDGHIYDIAVFRAVLTQPEIAAVIGEFPA
jgi:hypothetical protein